MTPGPEIEPGPQLIDQRGIYCIHVTDLGLTSRTFKLHWFALLKCVLWWACELGATLYQTATKLKLVATGRSHSESLTTCFWLNVIPSSSRWFQAHFPIFWWIILITLVFGFTTLRRNVAYRSSTSHWASHLPLAVQSNRPYIVHNTVPRDPQCSSHRLVDRHLKVHRS